MKIFIGIVSLFLSLCVFALEIKLPPKPGPENDKTLYGVDANKNNVRDDIEHFIFEEITKDPELYMAYLKRVETYNLTVKSVNDLKQFKFYVNQATNDGYCFSSVNKEQHGKATENIAKIYQLYQNTKDRKKAVSALDKNFSKVPHVSKETPEFSKWRSLCRF